MKRQFFCALAILGALCGPAFADRSELPLSTPTVIADLDGSARVLFHQPDLSALENHMIFAARLEFELPSVSGVPEFLVQVNALRRSWSDGQVTWRVPWTSPGGDREDTYFCSAGVRDGGRSLELDVTSIVRAAVEGEIESHGFVLSVPYEAGRGFRAAELSRLGSLSAGILVVEHRKFRSTQAARDRAQDAVAARPARVTPRDDPR